MQRRNISFLPNIRSIWLLFSIMFSLLVILFIIKLYARMNTFKYISFLFHISSHFYLNSLSIIKFFHHGLNFFLLYFIFFQVSRSVELISCRVKSNGLILFPCFNIDLFQSDFYGNLFEYIYLILVFVFMEFCLGVLFMKLFDISFILLNSNAVECLHHFYKRAYHF